MKKSKSSVAAVTGAAAALATLFATPASAEVITDPAGDFLPSYLGNRGGDLDVLRAGVTFDGTSFIFESAQAARTGTTPTGFYVWGIERGASTNRFGILSGPGGTYDARNVVFDSVLVIRPSGSSNVTDLSGAAPVATVLPASSISISGNEVRAIVPASLLPPRGLAFEQYGFNLWPRDAALPMSDAQISDFAPDNSIFRVTRVSEPASLALLGLGGLLAGMLTGRRFT